MKQRNQKSEKGFCRGLILWCVVSQILGFTAALAVGSVLDAGIKGYIIGYGMGVALSLGITVGIS